MLQIGLKAYKMIAQIVSGCYISLDSFCIKHRYNKRVSFNAVGFLAGL